jgi:hypothetical protein
VRLVPNGGLGDENRGVYRAITREDDNSSSLCSDFPEPPNRSTFRRRLRFWSRRWSGRPFLNFMALLYPLVYLQSQRRLDALSSALYYAGATWSVIPGSESFFGTAGIRLPSPAERLQCREE